MDFRLAVKYNACAAEDFFVVVLQGQVVDVGPDPLPAWKAERRRGGEAERRRGGEEEEEGTF